MVLALIGSFIIGFFSGQTLVVRRYGDAPLTIPQQKELEKLECLRAAQTPGEMEECPI